MAVDLEERIVKTQSRRTAARAVLGVGDRVGLLPHCPIDFEGVGPVPGMEGEIINVPARQDFRRCVGVRFDGLPCEWLIPSACLKRHSVANREHGH